MVWIGDVATARLVTARYLAARDCAKVVVSSRPPPDGPLGFDHIGVEGRIDAIREAILTAARLDTRTRFVIHLDDIAATWGAEGAADLFGSTCPLLYEVDTPALWLVSAHAITPALRRRLVDITQCVIEHEGERLRVVKADGRPSIVGRMYELVARAEGLEVRDLPAGRLGENLRRIRRERGLTQAELAQMAGISASAISQVEMGLRGMALDTAATLAAHLEITVDELLDRAVTSGHSLRRRPDSRLSGPLSRLYDDPHQPLQAYAVELERGRAGKPPTIPRTAELVLVTGGVLQVEVGGHSYALRRGDGLLATTDRITGWRNLLERTTTGFWIAG